VCKTGRLFRPADPLSAELFFIVQARTKSAFGCNCTNNLALMPAGPASGYGILNPDASQVSKILDSPDCLDISMTQYNGTRPAGENFEAIFSLD
jgi:hypothetical protein